MDPLEKFIGGSIVGLLALLIGGAFIRSAYQSHLVATHPRPIEFACADSGSDRAHPACLTLAQQK